MVKDLIKSCVRPSIYIYIYTYIRTQPTHSTLEHTLELEARQTKGHDPDVQCNVFWCRSKFANILPNYAMHVYSNDLCNVKSHTKTITSCNYDSPWGWAHDECMNGTT
jgi:hypothetical protein